MSRWLQSCEWRQASSSFHSRSLWVRWGLKFYYTVMGWMIVYRQGCLFSPIPTREQLELFSPTNCNDLPLFLLLSLSATFTPCALSSSPSQSHIRTFPCKTMDRVITPKNVQVRVRVGIFWCDFNTLKSPSTQKAHQRRKSNYERFGRGRFCYVGCKTAT